MLIWHSVAFQELLSIYGNNLIFAKVSHTDVGTDILFRTLPTMLKP